jgi:hypothetical protein
MEYRIISRTQSQIGLAAAAAAAARARRATAAVRLLKDDGAVPPSEG